MNERLSEVMGAALVGNNFSPIPLKFSFHMKKKSDLSRPDKALKPFLTFKLKKYCKMTARFLQASRSLPAATAAN